MAKIQPSVLIDDIRGTAGSCTFQLNATGRVVRGRIVRRAYVSPAQQIQRAQMALVTALWKSYSMYGLRYGWLALAQANPKYDRFHVLRPITASQFFAQANRNRQTLGQTLLATAPSTWVAENPTTLTLSRTIGTPNHLYVTPATNPSAGYAVVTRATPPKSQGIGDIDTSAKIIRVDLSPASPPWDIYSDWAAMFGTPTVDLNIHLSVTYIEIASGCAGPAISKSVTW